MITIASIGVDHYQIPLPVVLSDSTHGDIGEFELVTVRLRDTAGTEGLGYTYTVGKGGAAIAALIERDLRPLVIGASRIASRRCGSACGGGFTSVAAVGMPASRSRPSTLRSGI